MNGVELIAVERKRQIEVEGWDAANDDEHGAMVMALAGAVYVLNLTNVPHDGLWPFDYEYWKPTPDDPIRQLVKAGALIAAEIDKMQRQNERERI